MAGDSVWNEFSTAVVAQYVERWYIYAFKQGAPVDDEVRRAWDIASNTRLGVRRGLSRSVVENAHEGSLEGTVFARSAFRPLRGPVTTEIQCGDEAVWVIDYDEQSPYHAFIGRRVVASGFPCHPPSQHRIHVTGHFAVSRMQLAEPAPDAWLTEVGAAQELSGRFEHRIEGETAESEFSFMTEHGEAFPVINNPAGMAVDKFVNTLAYPVQPSPILSRRLRQPHWVICPFSYAQLQKLRDGPNGGLPNDIYLDVVSGQVRSRSAAQI